MMAGTTPGVFQPNLSENEVIAFLVRGPDGSWKATTRANPGELGVEAIWLNSDQKRIGLATKGTAANSAATGADVCDLNTTGDRSRSGYSLCNSELVTEVRDIGVLLRPLLAITGAKIRAFKVDEEKMRAALGRTDLDALYAQANELEQASLARSRQRTRTSNEQRSASLNRWRANLAPGNRTACGLAVELRPPLVSVQFHDATRWVRIDQLFPPGYFRSVGEARQHCLRL
ncbi:hypothetical protein GYB61_11400 [bacterium]|nr:hypothetical protein [bacterium]